MTMSVLRDRQIRQFDFGTLQRAIESVINREVLRFRAYLTENGAPVRLSRQPKAAIRTATSMQALCDKCRGKHQREPNKQSPELDSSIA